MTNSRIGNTKRILSSGMLNRIIHMVLPFVNRTIIIYTLGSEFVGLSGLFTSIIQVLSLAEFGINKAVVFSLYEPLTKNNTDAISAMICRLRKIYRIVGTVILCGGIVATPFVTVFIHGSYPQNINIYCVFLLYLFNSGISYFLFAHKEAILIADQRSDVSTNIRSIVAIFVGILQCLALVVFKNYYLFIILLVIGTILSNILVNRIVDKRYPYLQELFGAEVVKMPPRMQKQFKGLFINHISNISRNAFDSLVISSTLGLVYTAIYGNYYLIYSAVLGFTTIMSNSMQASVGNSMVLRSATENYENLLDFSFLYSWIIGWCSITMACLYQPFMKLWVGNNLLLEDSDMILFAVYFYCINMNHIRNQYIFGRGMWWEMRIAYLAESVGNLVLNIFLGKLFGITGVLIATILTIFFCNYLMGNAVLFREYFKEQSIKQFYKQQGYYLFICVGIGAIVYFVCQNVTENLILRGMMCLVIPNLLFLIFYKPCSRWKSSMKLVQQVFYSN